LQCWNIECEDFGLNERQRCARLPYYCSKEVREVVELLDGYLSESWKQLETDLKEQYWQNDTQKNTITALSQLIRDAKSLDLSEYVLRYLSITGVLIEKKEMSIMQHC